MDYNKIYSQLIDRARDRILEGYSERHHIIPICLGGLNKSKNIVRLTPEEHFLSHQLLVKIYPDKEPLIYALHWMTVDQKRTIRNNKEFGWIRKRMGDFMKGENNPAKRPEVRKKLSEGKIGENNPMFGKPITNEHRRNLSIAQTKRWKNWREKRGRI